MDYVKIKTAATAAVTEVRLYDETVAKVVRVHPEVPIGLPSMAKAVEKAVVNPSRVDLRRARSVVYIDEATTNAGGDPLHVPCRIVEGTSARVTSIYFASSSVPEDDK